MNNSVAKRGEVKIKIRNTDLGTRRCDIGWETGVTRVGQKRFWDLLAFSRFRLAKLFNTLRTGLLNCLNARSRGLTFRHRTSCI